MPQYYGIVRRDPAAGFTIDLPDFPDCTAVAEHFDGIVGSAAEAIARHLGNGREPPPPLALEEVGRRHAEELADGAFVLVVPVEPHARHGAPPLDLGVLRAIDAAATLRRLSLCLFAERQEGG